MKTIAVFFGGNSNEREISIVTGMMVINLLRSTDCNVLPIYLTEHNKMTFAARAVGIEDFIAIKKLFPFVQLLDGAVVHEKNPKRKIANVDCALNCCHGGMGEDGTLSALLAWNKIPTASPDTAISCAFMDKSIAKIVANGLGISVLPSLTVNETEWRSDCVAVAARVYEFGYPVIVKPVTLGSSIGISVATSEDALRVAFELAFSFDDCVLIEPYLAERRDLNCAAYRENGKIILSPIEEVFSDSDILTFRDKYEGGNTRRSQIPAEISQATKERIERALTEIYSAFRANGVVRGDFLLSGDDVYFNELNTVPGSLAYYLYAKSLTQARMFLLRLIEEAKIPKQKQLLVTGVLSRTDFRGAKEVGRRRRG